MEVLAYNDLIVYFTEVYQSTNSYLTNLDSIIGQQGNNEFQLELNLTLHNTLIPLATYQEKYAVKKVLT
jgi:hypothetical protein